MANFEHLRALPDGTLTQAEVGILLDEIALLADELEEAKVACIIAANPGIDEALVRRSRAGRSR